MSIFTFYNLAVISRTTSFNIQKFYLVHTLPLRALYELLPCTILTDTLCTTEVDSVYNAVRTESSYNTYMFCG
jgi:hypothetical protein